MRSACPVQDDMPGTDVATLSARTLPQHAPGRFNFNTHSRGLACRAFVTVDSESPQQVSAAVQLIHSSVRDLQTGSEYVMELLCTSQSRHSQYSSALPVEATGGKLSSVLPAEESVVQACIVGTNRQPRGSV